LVRDIIYTLICGNPNIENQNKPNSPTDLYKLSIDEEILAKKKKEKTITPKELEKIRQRLAKM